MDGRRLPRTARRIRIGPLWVDALTFEEAIDCAAALAGMGGAVFTPNVDHVVLASSDPALREAYSAAELVVADGQWVVWASRLLGTPLPAKISGSDLALPLARKAADQGRSLYLLGGAPGSAEAAAARLVRETGVRIAGVEAPRVDLSAPDEALVDRIRAAKPDFVLVALGAPKQELWIHRHLSTSSPAGCAGRPAGCRARDSSGCSGWRSNRGGSRAGICSTTPVSRPSSCASC